MSSVEAGPSRRRRRYAVRACNGCRRRRCKCDGVQPVCGTCAATCTWSSEGDARRPATKQLVESLRIKIQVLEAEVARLRGDEPTEQANSPGDAQLFVQGSSSLSQPRPTSVDGSAEGNLLSDGSPVSPCKSH
ncbi:hypothetical protein FRC12_024714 [Ceratobasidium sp. 428]|nr:hypothetical protein FRC12_024714 [Ceratobasidium sp. 428]